MRLELIATATFGLEAVVKREIEQLGYRILKTEDGKVTYMGDERAIVRSNLWLRSADRVLLKMAEFEAREFEELFQRTKALDWEQLVPLDGKFTVTGTSVKSRLHSVPACQKIVKKAIVEKLKEFYDVETFPETGAQYTVKVTILKDRVTLTIDTSGAGLHKRGYRQADVAAPIKETLAAALVQLSFWKAGRILVDPCCGSGTIPIEAAMIGLNMAPCMNRTFDMCGWKFFDRRVFDDAVEKARAAVTPRELRVYGFDIDESAVSLARKHAERCGVEKHIHFQRQDFRDFSSKQRYGVIVSNPPYGERLMNQREVRGLYRDLGEKFFSLKDWSCGIITSYYAFESAFGKKADKNRKFFNSNIECRFFQYLGAKPPEKHQ